MIDSGRTQQPIFLALADPIAIQRIFPPHYYDEIKPIGKVPFTDHTAIKKTGKLSSTMYGSTKTIGKQSPIMYGSTKTIRKQSPNMYGLTKTIEKQSPNIYEETKTVRKQSPPLYGYLNTRQNYHECAMKYAFHFISNNKESMKHVAKYFSLFNTPSADIFLLFSSLRSSTEAHKQLLLNLNKRLSWQRFKLSQNHG